MKSSKQKKSLPFGARCLGVAAIAAGGLLFGAAPGWAADDCIQDVWQAHGNNQNLTCTAQDVTLSRVTNINITAGGQCQVVDGERVCTCNLGGNVTFTADFQMDLTADTRYDTGFYIAEDDDPDGDGALTGLCQSTEINVLNGENFVNLDAVPGKEFQEGDTCGDITGPLGTEFNPQIVHYTLTVPCSDPDGNDQLDLDWCTTWRQPGANEVCDGTGNGLSTNDVFPGSPSKCNCGTEPIDIFFETATITTTKTALAPATVAETGGSQTYSVQIANNAQQAVLTVDSITDDKYGDVTTTHAAGGGFLEVTATTCVPDQSTATCEIGGTIAAGGSCSCTFTGPVPAGDSGGTFVDTVDACGTDSFGNTDICDDDDATVTYTDVPQPPTLSKTATGNVCRIDSTYTVVVTNTSAQDALTLNSLTDDVYGSITTVHVAGNGFREVLGTTCGVTGPGLGTLSGQTGAGALPKVIAASGNYTCSFVGRNTSCSETIVDTVTGSATDDDGATYNGDSTPPFEDDATVTVTVTTP